MRTAPAAWIDAEADLTLLTVRRDGELVVRAIGSLDHHTAGLLLGCVRSWADAAEGRLKAVVLDLAGLRGSDAVVVPTLLRCRRLLRARAGALRVVNAPAELGLTLARAGLVAPGRLELSAPSLPA